MQLSHKAKELIQDDAEVLSLFNKKLTQFNDLFCQFMIKGSDFTLKLEVRGNKGKVLHIRMNGDDLERPASAGKNKK